MMLVALLAGGLSLTLWWVAMPVSRVAPTPFVPRRDGLTGLSDGQIAWAMHLIAGALSAGLSPQSAIDHVARATTGVLHDDLTTVQHALRWGATAEEAWGLVGGQWLPLARALRASQDRGVASAVLVGEAASDLEQRIQGLALEKGQTLGVSVVLPLGLCALPGFIGIGLLPHVVVMIQRLVSP